MSTKNAKKDKNLGGPLPERKAISNPYMGKN